MKKIRNVYYFDYSPEAYNYIMSSKILRQSEKNILNDIIRGKTVKELAIDNRCSEMTMDLLVDSYKWLKLSEYVDGEDKSKYKQVSDTLFEMFMVEHNNIG